MAVRSQLLIPILFGLLASAGSACADTLLVERIAHTRASTLPLKGSSMSAVEASFGAPEAKHAAVGKPPITRWVYPAFSVYFEYDHVINAVVNKASPEEKGPRPVPPQHSRL
jgi:hypothetical protein